MEPAGLFVYDRLQIDHFMLSMDPITHGGLTEQGLRLTLAHWAGDLRHVPPGSGLGQGPQPER